MTGRSYFSVPCRLICSRRISSSWNSNNPYQKTQPKGLLINIGSNLQKSERRRGKKSETERGKKWRPVESRKRCVVPSSWNHRWRASSWCPAFGLLNYNQLCLLGRSSPLLNPSCMLKASLSMAYKKRGIRNCKVPKKGKLLPSPFL